MRPGAVPVALLRLGGEGDDDVVVLGDAVQQPAGHVQVVADGQRVGGADLELPLAGHDLGVGALDHQAGVDARLGVLLDDLAADDPAGADAAVVRALRGGEAAAVGEAERRAVRLEHRVLLLDAVDHLQLGVLLGDLGERRAGVGDVRLHVAGVEHLAEHEDVVAAADRVGAGEHGLQHAVAALARGLLGRRAVEAPDRELLAVVHDLRLRPQQRCRRHAVEPDVFSLVGHSCSFVRRDHGARRVIDDGWQAVSGRFLRGCPSVNAV